MKDGDRRPSWPAAGGFGTGIGWPSSTLTTSRSTSGIASKTFSRKRFPGVTRVTFCRDRRGQDRPGGVVGRQGIGAVDRGAEPAAFGRGLLEHLHARARRGRA